MRSSWAASVAGFGPLEIALAALVALIGALVIHNWPGRHRKRMEALEKSVSAGQANPVAVSDAGLEQAGAVIRAAAARMGLPEHLLPRMAAPSGSEGDFVYRDGADFVYCSLERGSRISEHRTTDIDELLYRIFRDRAWTRAYISLIGQDIPEQEHAARLAAGQLALLEKADPRWAERLRSERD